EGLDYPDKVYKVVKALYGLHQAPRAWYETLTNYLLENGFQRGKIDQTLFIKKQKDGKSASTLIDTEKPLLKDPDVKRIFRYLKGKPHLGLWYPKDSPFNLVAYSDSDYIAVATSSTEAEYVAAASCCAQILDFLNASVIKYALTVNPTIYVSCIKQFWSSVSLKKTNDVVHLQALIDRRKEIFAELERMRYEKPSTNLTFYKAFFSTQWKFLIHTILQCMSSKRTAWNEFSSSMASAVICLATGMLVLQQVNDDDVADVVAKSAAEDENAAEPTPPTLLLHHRINKNLSLPHHRRVENLEQDKIAQALEMTKLKQRVRKLEKKIKLKVYGLKRLRKVPKGLNP
nr:reverse transcriptase [Tanacetum cinerariifolium]